jgi:hypothetical protein
MLLLLQLLAMGAPSDPHRSIAEILDPLNGKHRQESRMQADLSTGFPAIQGPARLALRYGATNSTIVIITPVKEAPCTR